MYQNNTIFTLKKSLMKKFFLLLITTLVFCSSCSNDEEIDVSVLNGTWDECYDNPSFIMDGIVEYTFLENGTYQVYSYDALSHKEHTKTSTYILQEKVLILNDNTENELCYNIIKLNKNEMAWQREGTKYSEGTLGSDYKHFKRIKDK